MHQSISYLAINCFPVSKPKLACVELFNSLKNLITYCFVCKGYDSLIFLLIFVSPIVYVKFLLLKYTFDVIVIENISYNK